ncbi:MAG: tetratricopeptide repeat protein [Acidobacteria bacterium]|nr:tetratricopeptide repeat protein [Acidobacteriota bacterium]
MNRLAWIIIFVMVATAMTAPVAQAFQGSVTRGPVEEPRDPELEKQSLHYLEVARFYFKKKRWAAARTRLQEIVANNLRFAEIAEVYFLLGEVYLKTDERDLALELFSRVTEEFPQSEFAEKARARLQEVADKKSQQSNHNQERKEM